MTTGSLCYLWPCHLTTQHWRVYEFLLDKITKYMYLTCRVILTLSVVGNSCMRNSFLNHVYCAEMLSPGLLLCNTMAQWLLQREFSPNNSKLHGPNVSISFERYTANATVCWLQLISSNTELLSSTMVSVQSLWFSSRQKWFTVSPWFSEAS